MAREELDVCRDHWHEVLHRSGGLIRSIRLIPRPACLLSDCDNAAVEIVEDKNGLPLPVCGRHWDELSWIDLPNDLASRQPGWSHGR